MALVLAIDQSTSATKAIVFEEDGGVVARAAREHRQIYPEPGHVEHDAEEIWQNTLTVVGEAVAACGGRAGEVACVSISNQRETILTFDRASGRPLANALVWQCRRGAAICQQMAAAGHEGLIQRRTGLKLDTYFSASKLKWLAARRPEIAAAWRDGTALIGTIDAYLIYRLTGGRVFATDHTNASRTLLYDLHRRGWSEELCGLFDVPRQALPEVRGCDARFGLTDVGGVLGRAVPICGVMGDSQAALLAHRCLTPGTAKVTFGTGSSVLLTVGPEPPAAERGTVAALAWVIGGQPTYCSEGIINYSAATLTWLRDQLGLVSDVAEAEQAATQVPDTGGVYLVPAFAGLGAPWWQPQARAALVGMSSGTDRRHVLRAALESIAYQVRDVLDMLGRSAQVTLGPIHADGGATTNRFLMQFVADVTGCELLVADHPDCSPLGAAAAGLLGLGLCTAFESLPAIASALRCPVMDRRRADALHAGWQRAVRQVISGVVQ